MGVDVAVCRVHEHGREPHPDIHGLPEMKKARCREEVAAGSISNVAREEVRPIQRWHRIWEE